MNSVQGQWVGGEMNFSGGETVHVGDLRGGGDAGFISPARGEIGRALNAAWRGRPGCRRIVESSDRTFGLMLDLLLQSFTRPSHWGVY